MAEENQEEDPEVLEEQRKATERLSEVLKSADIQAEVMIHDWKDHQGHAEDFASFMRKHPGWLPYVHEEGFPFQNGSGDDIVTVLTSKAISEEQAQEIADLFYNCGADLPELPEVEEAELEVVERYPEGCSFCPTCGHFLEVTKDIDDVASTHQEQKCSNCGLEWMFTYHKGMGELLLHICPLVEGEVTK